MVVNSTFLRIRHHPRPVPERKPFLGVSLGFREGMTRVPLNRNNRDPRQTRRCSRREGGYDHASVWSRDRLAATCLSLALESVTRAASTRHEKPQLDDWNVLCHRLSSYVSVSWMAQADKHGTLAWHPCSQSIDVRGGTPVVYQKFVNALSRPQFLPHQIPRRCCRRSSSLIDAPAE